MSLPWLVAHTSALPVFVPFDVTMCEPEYEPKFSSDDAARADVRVAAVERGVVVRNERVGRLERAVALHGEAGDALDDRARIGVRRERRRVLRVVVAVARREEDLPRAVGHEAAARHP